jgi:hypothetical protein
MARDGRWPPRILKRRGFITAEELLEADLTAEALAEVAARGRPTPEGIERLVEIMHLDSPSGPWPQYSRRLLPASR